MKCKRESEMLKVSVVVPVYNTERYLKKCLDSLVNQTLQEMEVICVDDGSTDGSPAILDEYAAKYTRVHVIHKENGGMVSARKAGERAAAGKYIGYMDSDDWSEPDMYGELYRHAAEYGAEMVASGYFLEGDYTSRLLDSVEGGFYEGEGMRVLRDNTIYCLGKKETGIRASRCCKLFLRELLQNLPLPVPEDISISEDKMQVLACILECRSVFVLKEAYYHYRINPLSSTHKADPSYLLCVDKVYQYVRKLYPHPNFTDNMRRQAELYIMEMLLAGMNTRLGFKVRNLLWFDPYWLDLVPAGSRVILYGGGEAGRKCRVQLLAKGCHTYAGCVDFEHTGMDDGGLDIQPPGRLGEMDYDYIVITIKNPAKAALVQKQLEGLGIRRGKILWFEQKELFWRYAEAEGLLQPGGQRGTGA